MQGREGEVGATMRRMLRSELESLFVDVLDGRRLLEHPFYRRWEAGELAPSELAAYAGQYRHFERLLPEILERITARIDDPAAKNLVQANLDDERSVPEPHLALFDEFCAAVGGESDDAPSGATEALTGIYRRFAESHPSEALAAIAAYEVQAAEIATSKATGLRVHYGLEETHTRFWDVHGSIDSTHATWTLDALAAIGSDETQIRLAAGVAAEGWWSFLDEREKAGASTSTA